MSTVLFHRIGTTFTVRFRYDPAVVELLKTAVPSYNRAWDPDTKQWTIAASSAEKLASALRATGHQVIGLDPPKTGTTVADTAHWARILLHRVGPSRREPVFRALTRILHPDNPGTGDNELMRDLNTAREELDR